MSSLEIEDEELTMRIFPMPLSGEKKKMGKIEGGEALLIDKFSRVLFSLYRNLSWEFPFCRHILLFTTRFWSIHPNAPPHYYDQKTPFGFDFTTTYTYILHYSCKLLPNLFHSIIYFFIWMYKNEIDLAWVVFLHLKDNRNVHNYKFLYRTIY